jgi:hypothetical protein
MKKLISSLLVIAVVYLISVSCERQKDKAPELPPYSSMVIDFDQFKVNDSKSAVDGLKSTETGTVVNFVYAGLNIVVFNVILTGALVVPVAAFYNSFTHDPVFLSDATWQWSYDYNSFGGTYHARLTGQVRSSDVKWEMYISKDGIGAFPEFKWFEGTSLLDGSGGQWILNVSYAFQEPLLQIDWTRSGEDVGEIQYTIVRELNNDRTPNLQYQSFIKAGFTAAELNAFYTIHVYDAANTADFVDVFIEWSTTTYNGHVKSSSYYKDDAWHCWDSYGYDISCE